MQDMPDDRISIIAAPDQSVEEIHGVTQADSRIYPGVGTVTVPSAAGQNPLTTTLFTVRVLKPALSAGVWSYTVERDITHLIRYMDWEFLRIGGLGPATIQAAAELESEAATWAASRYEIEINIKLPTDTALATWYRGIIESMRSRRVGGGMQITIEANGFTNELRKIRIDNNYAAGTTIRAIVEAMLDDDIVGANCRILKDTGKLITAGASYTTAGVVTVQQSAFDAMKMMAEFQGSIQWGVDAEREFFFLADPGTTSQDQYFIGGKISEPMRSSRNWENFNAIEF